MFRSPYSYIISLTCAIINFMLMVVSMVKGDTVGVLYSALCLFVNGCAVFILRNSQKQTRQHLIDENIEN